MNRSRLAFALLLSCILAVTITTAIRTTQPEPEYNGKKLSEWAGQYESSLRPWAPTLRTQAVYAAHQTRDQLVPYALKFLQQEPPAWRTALERKLEISGFANRIPRGFWNLLASNPGRIHATIRSTTYFAMLGADANGAVPELASLLRTKSGEVRLRAIYALCYIGKEGQTRLAEILIEPTYLRRRGTAYTIEGLQKNGVRVNILVPSLIEYLADSDHIVVKQTAYALGEMAIEPALTVPALTNCLQSSDIYVRGAALDALAKFGARARSAIPALVAELNDPDSSVRKWATNALTAVAPEELEPGSKWSLPGLDLSPWPARYGGPPAEDNQPLSVDTEFVR